MTFEIYYIGNTLTGAACRVSHEPAIFLGGDAGFCLVRPCKQETVGRGASVLGK